MVFASCTADYLPSIDRVVAAIHACKLVLHKVIDFRIQTQFIQRQLYYHKMETDLPTV